jgi:hypothetical protein
VLPRSDQEYERSKELVVDTICGGLQPGRASSPAVSG